MSPFLILNHYSLPLTSWTLIMPKLYKARPPLKVSESAIEQGGDAYIEFEEFIDIPGLENAHIRIEFDRAKSITEVSALAKQLKDAGFVFVVQK